jgi:virginiamycin B lyase
MRILLAGLSILISLGSLAVAQGSDRVEITEWLVPWSDSRPRDPFVDQLGRVWFNAQSGNYLGYLEPGTGAFRRFELEAGTHPHNLIVDEEGSVWYAGNRNAHIGKLNPDTGEITKFPMPDPAAGDPHTLVLGTEQDIWFTVQWGNFIGRLERASGEIQLVPVTTPRARPYGIKRTPENRPWIVLLGTNKLATIDPQTMELQEIGLPRMQARPRRLEITPDGSIWYVDFSGGYLGRYRPALGEFHEWLLPGGASSRPYGTALDHLGRIWIAETGTLPNRLVGFDPGSETFFSISEIPSGGSVRHMYFHELTKEVWFGVDTNYLARALVSE